MNSSEIEQAWNDAIIMLLNSTATKTQKAAVRAQLTALRDEMMVQARMIESAMKCSWLANDYFMDYHRKQAEKELKGESDA